MKWVILIVITIICNYIYNERERVGRKIHTQVKFRITMYYLHIYKYGYFGKINWL